MKIVIDLDENLYTRLFDNGVELNTDDRCALERSVRSGKVLPKHMRLIDADKTLNAMNTYDKFGYLPHDLIRLSSKNGLKLIPYVHYDAMVACISNMPTVIEADTEA